MLVIFTISIWSDIEKIQAVDQEQNIFSISLHIEMVKITSIKAYI